MSALISLSQIAAQAAQQWKLCTTVCASLAAERQFKLLALVKAGLRRVLDVAKQGVQGRKLRLLLVVGAVGALLRKVLSLECMAGTRMRLFTFLVNLTSKFYGRDFRTSFRKIEWSVGVAPTGKSHSHPDSAKTRTEATRIIDRYITSQGFRPYSISISETDMKRGQQGVKMLFTAKDTLYRTRDDAVKNDHIYKLCDVDYYLDMPALLAEFRPLLLWTTVPTMAAGSVDNGAYTFDDTGAFQLTMTSGARYAHQLWNYESDHLVVRYWWGAVCYFVEQVVCPRDRSRRIIGLFPARKVFGPLGWFLPEQTLQRRRVVREGKTRRWSVVTTLVDDVETAAGAELRLKRKPTPEDRLLNAGMVEYTSFGHAGERRCASMPHHVITVAYLKYRRAVQSPVSSVDSYLRVVSSMHPWLAVWGAEVMDFTTMASLLIDAFEDCPNLFEVPLGELHSSLPVPDVTSYTPYRGQVLEDEKCVTRSLLPVGAAHFTNMAVGPTRGIASDTQCIEGRIIAIRNPRSGNLSDEKAAAWFFERLLRQAGVEPHTLVPTSFEEVFERQKRPTQRQILRLAEDWFLLISNKLKTFMKAESYGKVTDPRNITTIFGTCKLNYSRYTYSFQNVMKKIPWYAFSKSPKDIGRAINSILRGKNNVVPTDFSRWDGRVSEWLTGLFLQLLKRSFAVEYHDDLERSFWLQYNCKATTSNGVSYMHGCDMPSGSPHTSIFNSVMNALVNFLARVESGESYELAWEGLGIYGGDDGLTPDIQPAMLERTAARLGLSLKAKSLTIGQVVDFLGRDFFDAWGDCGLDGPASTIDVARQLSKLYVTTSPHTVPDAEVLCRKAAGYLITDPNTPVLANWARAVARCYPTEFAFIERTLEDIANDESEADRLAGDSHETRFHDINWFATFLRRDGRFNSKLPVDTVIGHISKRSGFSPAELGTLCAQLDAVRNADELLWLGGPDALATTPVEISARVGDDLVIVEDDRRAPGAIGNGVQPVGDGVAAKADPQPLSRRGRKRAGATKQAGGSSPKACSEPPLPPALAPKTVAGSAGAAKAAGSNPVHTAQSNDVRTVCGPQPRPGGVARPAPGGGARKSRTKPERKGGVQHSASLAGVARGPSGSITGAAASGSVDNASTRPGGIIFGDGVMPPVLTTLTFDAVVMPGVDSEALIAPRPPVSMRKLRQGETEV